MIKDGIDGTPDKRKPNEYPSIRLWHYSQKYDYKLICDKFGAKRKYIKKKWMALVVMIVIQ